VPCHCGRRLSSQSSCRTELLRQAAGGHSPASPRQHSIHSTWGGLEKTPHWARGPPRLRPWHAVWRTPHMTGSGELLQAQAHGCTAKDAGTCKPGQVHASVWKPNRCDANFLFSFPSRGCCGRRPHHWAVGESSKHLGTTCEYLRVPNTYIHTQNATQPYISGVCGQRHRVRQAGRSEQASNRPHSHTSLRGSRASAARALQTYSGCRSGCGLAG
jgi:hypothetical protein